MFLPLSSGLTGVPYRRYPCCIRVIYHVVRLSKPIRSTRGLSVWWQYSSIYTSALLSYLHFYLFIPWYFPNRNRSTQAEPTASRSMVPMVLLGRVLVWICGWRLVRGICHLDEPGFSFLHDPLHMKPSPYKWSVHHPTGDIYFLQL